MRPPRNNQAQNSESATAIRDAIQSPLGSDASHSFGGYESDVSSNNDPESTAGLSSSSFDASDGDIDTFYQDVSFQQKCFDFLYRYPAPTLGVVFGTASARVLFALRRLQASFPPSFSHLREHSTAVGPYSRFPPVLIASDRKSSSSLILMTPKHVHS